MTGAIAGPVEEGGPASDFSARTLDISVIIAFANLYDPFCSTLDLVRLSRSWSAISPFPGSDRSDLNAKLLGSHGVPYCFDIVD